MILHDKSMFRASQARYEQNSIDKIQPTWTRRTGRRAPPTDERLRHLIRNQVDGPFRGLALERLIGGNDLQNINYLELGIRIGHAVGRIHVRTPNGEAGFGTGFLISPRLVMTNHHVLEVAEWASRSHIEFNYQSDSFGKPCPTYAFQFDPAAFFYSDAKLDFAVVAVKDNVFPNGIQLKALGFNPLNEIVGKVDAKEFLSIIQHPGGEIKQVAIRENELLDKSNPDFLWYSTDTTQGSSGSPVYNDQWQAVALHHLGVPEMDGDRIRLIDGGYWTPGVDDSMILWKANEGTRVSAIVKNLEANVGNDPFIREARDVSKVPPYQTASSLLTLNGTPSVVIAGATTSSNGSSVTVTAGSNGLTERVDIDPDYSNRKGYDPDFLDGYPIDLSAIVEPFITAQKVAPLIGGSNGHTRYELKYEHFSVFMHRQRRMSLLTAVNINGQYSKNVERTGDKWILDSRMDARFQIGNEIYASNSLDRGHMVRRLDPAWGKTMRVALRGNNDTFHYTNACPQHKNLNQRIWSELEDFILENTGENRLRVSVLTGPVLNAETDLPYRGFLLPLQYWKVASFITSDGTPSSTAFLLSHEAMLGDLEERMNLREADFSFSGDPKFSVYQVSLEYLTQLAGLNFSGLEGHDPLHESKKEALKGLNVKESFKKQYTEIKKPEDIQLRRPVTAENVE